MLHFRIQDILGSRASTLEPGDSEQLDVALTGRTVDEVMLQGFDTIELFMPGNNRK